jgi:hypothetical protein
MRSLEELGAAETEIAWVGDGRQRPPMSRAGEEIAGKVTAGGRGGVR